MLTAPCIGLKGFTFQNNIKVFKKRIQVGSAIQL